jgi:hyperosmotically inducible protein
MSRSSSYTAALVFAAAVLASTASAGPSDAWITTKAKAALLATKGVSVTSIDVDTKQGLVTLTGKVPTENAREKAEAVVKDLNGVKSVDNRLIIEPEGAPRAAETPPSRVP